MLTLPWPDLEVSSCSIAFHSPGYQNLSILASFFLLQLPRSQTLFFASNSGLEKLSRLVTFVCFWSPCSRIICLGRVEQSILCCLDCAPSKRWFDLCIRGGVIHCSSAFGSQPFMLPYSLFSVKNNQESAVIGWHVHSPSSEAHMCLGATFRSSWAETESDSDWRVSLPWLFLEFLNTPSPLSKIRRLLQSEQRSPFKARDILDTCLRELCIYSTHIHMHAHTCTHTETGVCV